MKAIRTVRTVISALVAVTGLAIAQPGSAESNPLPYQSLQAEDPVSTQQERDHVIQLIASHLESWKTGYADEGAYAALVTDDVVFQYPYATDEATRHSVGRAATFAAVRRLSNEAADWQFRDFKLFGTPDRNAYFVEYKATAFVLATSRVYQQTYLARVMLRDGKIADYLELWDRGVKDTAFGTTTHPQLSGVPVSTNQQ